MNYYKILVLISSLLSLNYFGQLINLQNEGYSIESRKLVSAEDQCSLDVKINNFELLQDLSILLDLKIESDCYPDCRLSFYNVDSTERLSILFYPGSSAYHGSFFIVEQVHNSNLKLVGLSSADKFISGNGVSIGQNISTVRSILYPFKIEETYSNDTTLIEFSVNKVICEVLNDKYNMSEYSARYIFINESLVRFDFGFNYP
jgi:hypothetical protein